MTYSANRAVTMGAVGTPYSPSMVRANSARLAEQPSQPPTPKTTAFAFCLISAQSSGLSENGVPLLVRSTVLTDGKFLLNHACSSSRNSLPPANPTSTRYIVL